jgi:proteasome lid subunit RPN8/RPN11
MLKITETELDNLRRHAEESYPQECCGVLVGAIGEGTKAVHAVIRCRNTRTDSPRNRYNIDPRELIRIRREAAACGREIVGFYHSHPDEAARWSTTDLAEAYWTGFSYVITAVERGKAVETRSFELQGEESNKHFEDETIEVAGTSNP